MLDIHLLGRPRIELDGEARRLAGRKPWGFLAYLVLADRPTRQGAVDLLFGEADDPFAALRWALHQVRRGVEPQAEVVEADGVLQLRLGADARVDVLALLSGAVGADVVDELYDGALLQGLAFDDAPLFEQWLLLERGRIDAATFAANWSAASAIAGQDPDRALRLLRRALPLEPFCEGTNELVVDILVRQDLISAANDYADALEMRWLEELGAPMPGTIRRPLARTRLAAAVPVPAAAAAAMLETARARADAGDQRGAIETARRAYDASVGGEPATELAAIRMLVQIMIHAVRGHDVEAKGLIQRGLMLANELGDDAALSDLHREGGYVQLLEANYGGAEVSLAQALTHARAAGDVIAEAKTRTYLAMCASDRNAYDDAEAHARAAIAVLATTPEDGWTAYAHGYLARVLVRTGRPDEAGTVGAEGVRIAREARCMALLPWPLLQEAEAALRRGDRATAEILFTEAFAIGSENEDPCWECLALRGLALVHAEEGDTDAAVRLLGDALLSSRRFPDVYAWAEAVILTDLAELERGTDADHLAQALALATGGPMPDLATRLREISSPQTPLQTASG